MFVMIGSHVRSLATAASIVTVIVIINVNVIISKQHPSVDIGNLTRLVCGTRLVTGARLLSEVLRYVDIIIGRIVISYDINLELGLGLGIGVVSFFHKYPGRMSKGNIQGQGRHHGCGRACFFENYGQEVVIGPPAWKLGDQSPPVPKVVAPMFRGCSTSGETCPAQHITWHQSGNSTLPVTWLSCLRRLSTAGFSAIVDEGGDTHPPPSSTAL